jgi:DNA polymerase elongation subunit (family B)
VPRGWLLDITSSRAGDTLLLWIRERGGPVHRVEVPFLPPFFVTGKEERLRELGTLLEPRPDVAKLEEEPTLASLFEPEDPPRPTLAVTPSSHGRRRRLATEIDAWGGCTDFRLYDVDVSAPQQYYAEHGLFPGAPVAWSGQQLTALEAAEEPEYLPPPLKVLELTVEVVGAQRGRPAEPTDAVARVRLGEAVAEEESEKSTLLALVEELRRQDPDLLWTQGGDQFHFPQLYRRAIASGLGPEEFHLGREPAPFGLGRLGSSYMSYGRIYHQAPAFPLAGRFHLDMNERFVQDVSLAGFLDIARISRLGLQTVARQSPGTAFSAMEIARVLADGYHVPWKKNLPERPKSARRLVAADRGGLILTPPVGLFEEVDEFDFVSLYPSIMVEHNLSVETLDCPCCPESPHVAPGLGYRSCTLRDGLVPRTLRPILSRRRYFKRRKKETTGTEKERYTELGKAWKWVLVTSFGYQGYRNAKFGRIECHEAINAYARELLVELIATARSAGWEVVHGIVDSLWMLPPPGGDPEAFCKEVSARTRLPLGYEGRYRWIVFLPDAEYGLGVPQRYYGRFHDGEFKLRGIEVRRGDTCDFVRVTQEAVLELLGKAVNGEEFRAAIPRALALGKTRVDLLAEGNVPREELLLTQRVAQALEEYRLLSPTVAALRQLKEVGIAREPGQEVSFLLMERASRDWRRKARPEQLVTGEEDYDVQAYAELLARSFATLFAPFGLTEERVLRGWGYPYRATPTPSVRDHKSLEYRGQRSLWSAA